MDTNHSNVSLSNQQALIDLGQLDYGDAAVKLNGYTSAVQATQKAYAQVSKLSLFDVV
jgi:flagellar hook-associated protein 3 FlgL